MKLTKIHKEYDANICRNILDKRFMRIFFKKYFYTSLPNLLNIFCLKIIFFYMKIVLKGVRSVNTLECGGRAAPSNPAKKHKTAKKAYKKQKSMHLACFIAFLTTLIWT